MGTTNTFFPENLPQIFKICSRCNRVNRGDGSWLRLEHIHVSSDIKISHGLCLECCENSYMSLSEVEGIILEKEK